MLERCKLLTQRLAFVELSFTHAADQVFAKVDRLRFGFNGRTDAKDATDALA